VLLVVVWVPLPDAVQIPVPLVVLVPETEALPAIPLVAVNVVVKSLTVAE
jgi:hypothetical protein